MDSYVAKKSADCILYSEDGSQFKIHKELFGQTEFMRQILKSAKEQCCSMIEIFCPCQRDDLQNLVHFLYKGEINCDSETDYHIIFKNLNQIFGFAEDMHLRCEKKVSDENTDGSSLCEDIEVLSESFENITNESSVMEHSDSAKIIEDGTVSQSKLAVGKKKCASKKRFVCDDCGYAFGYKFALERHVNSVHLKLKPFKCNQCENSFSSESNLKKHVLAVHDKLKPFKCSLCSFKCSQKYHLNKHILAVHEKLKPFKCPHCERSFSMKCNLIIHARVIHKKVMQACPSCEKCFDQNNLKAHILAVHDTNKFKCTFCKLSYSEKRKLRAHVKAVHM